VSIGKPTEYEKSAWQQLIEQVTKQVDFVVAFTREAMTSSSTAAICAASAEAHAKQANEHARKAEQVLNRSWFQLGAVLVACIGLITGALWANYKMNDKLLEGYKQTTDMQIGVHNKNYTRLEADIKELKTLISSVSK